jgi:Protein of unknown function (DUF3053)
MNAVFYRAAGFAALSLFALGLVACGDSESDQRKAFIDFLQEINAKPGVQFLKPKPEEEKTFGPYAQHYAVIADFNAGLGKIFRNYENDMKKIGVGPLAQQRTIEQMIAHREDIVLAQSGTELVVKQIDELVAKTAAARATLKQPDDLKMVYDKTYDRLITAPVKAMKNSYQTLHEGFAVSLRLVDYINSHRDKISVSGSNVRATDQQTLNEVQALFKAHSDAGQRFQDAQRESQKVIRGY